MRYDGLPPTHNTVESRLPGFFPPACLRLLQQQNTTEQRELRSTAHCRFPLHRHNSIPLQAASHTAHRNSARSKSSRRLLLLLLSGAVCRVVAGAGADRLLAVATGVVVVAVAAASARTSCYGGRQMKKNSEETGGRD